MFSILCVYSILYFHLDEKSGLYTSRKKLFYETCDWLFIMCSTKKAVLPAVTLSLFISSIQLNYC